MNENDCDEELVRIVDLLDEDIDIEPLPEFFLPKKSITIIPPTVVVGEYANILSTRETSRVPAPRPRDVTHKLSEACSNLRGAGKDINEWLARSDDAGLKLMRSRLTHAIALVNDVISDIESSRRVRLEDNKKETWKP